MLSGLLLWARPGAGGEVREEKPAPVASVQADGGAAREDDRGLVGAPYVFYSPETRLGGGVGGLWYFRAAPGAVSLVKGSVRYTQRDQLMVGLGTELDWGDVRLDGHLRYERFPDWYYGIGPDAPAAAEEGYTPVTRSASLEVEHRLAGPLFGGWRIEVGSVDVVALEPGGLLAAGAPGAGGGVTAGAGPHLSWDTRSNPHAPRRGALLRASALRFDPLLGSDYAFERYTLDARRFVPLPAGHVLALRGVAQLHRGDAPFYEMAMLGGGRLLRGLYRGRYRDRHLVAAQAEYRLPLFWRLGLAAFAEAGTVAPRVADLSLADTKLGGGLGLRFAASVENHLNCRLDVGHADGTTQVHFTFGEAF